MPCNVESASLEPKSGSKFVAGGEDLWVHLFDFFTGEEIGKFICLVIDHSQILQLTPGVFCYTNRKISILCLFVFQWFVAFTVSQLYYHYQFYSDILASSSHKFHSFTVCYIIIISYILIF